jgi:hypothetical protein
LRNELEESQHAAAHEKGELKAELDKAHKEATRMKQQMEKLSIASGEAQSLRDELEELRHEANKVSVW